MSRIGRNPITIPAGTTVTVAGNIVTAASSKGELNVTIPEGFTTEQSDGQFVLTQVEQNRRTNAEFGLIRTLIANAVTGVTTGFEKKLEMNGVGFRVEKKGRDLLFSLGFSDRKSVV